MEMDLKSYIKIFPNMVEDHVCDQTVKELKETSWSQHGFTGKDYTTLITLSGDKELDVCYDSVSTYKYLMDKIWNSYFQYLQQLNFKWYCSWSGFNRIRFNRYENSKLMAKHCDHINSLFDGERRGVPTMTALGGLNDDYEGGEFVMFDDTIIPIEKGSIVVFPSNFLFPHRVEAVTNGARYTYVTWAW